MTPDYTARGSCPWGGSGLGGCVKEEARLEGTALIYFICSDRSELRRSLVLLRKSGWGCSQRERLAVLGRVLAHS